MYHFVSIDIHANRRVKEMIPLARTGVADRVSRIRSHLWMKFECNSGCEIACRMFAGVPVGVDVQILVHDLLKSKLAAATVGVRGNRIL